MPVMVRSAKRVSNHQWLTSFETPAFRGLLRMTV
jgi:hypothetical protein